MKTLLNKEEKVLLIQDFEGAIMMDGFQLYFYNSVGDNWQEVLEVLSEIGADKSLELFKKALNIFENSKPSTNQDTRTKIINLDDKDQSSFFDSIDQEFYSKSEDLGLLINNYLKV
jgi:hypothetical protein